MSGRRRKSGADEDGGDRKKKLLVWLAWGVVVALLGANLLSSSMFDKGFLTPDVLKAAALWILVGCAMTMSALGLYWSSKAYSQNERSSLLWARRGYVFGLIGSGTFLFACYDRDMFPREWIVSVAAAVIAGQSLLFGMMSFKEFRRAQSGGGGGRRGRSSDSAAVAPTSDDAPPAASPDPAK